MVVILYCGNNIKKETDGKTHFIGSWWNNTSFDRTSSIDETSLLCSRSNYSGSFNTSEQHSLFADEDSISSECNQQHNGMPSPRTFSNILEQLFSYPSKPNQNESNSVSLPNLNSIKMPSCHEDAMTEYVVENTPTSFSKATSLSSLIIEDDDLYHKYVGKNVSKKESKVIRSFGENLKKANSQINEDTVARLKISKMCDSLPTYKSKDLKTKDNKCVYPSRFPNDSPMETNSSTLPSKHLNSFNCLQKTDKTRLKTDIGTNVFTYLSFIPESSSSDSNSVCSSCDSSKDEQLLQQCILLGMPKENPQKKKLNQYHPTPLLEPNENPSEQHIYQTFSRPSIEHDHNELNTFIRGLIHELCDKITDGVELAASTGNYSKENPD